MSRWQPRPRAADPEITMAFITPIAGWKSVARGGLAALLLLLTFVLASAAEQFPFDQELVLDAARMGPGRRMPSITVEANGNLIVDLWCRSIRGRADIGDDSIAIVLEPLPEALPDVQSANQCTPARLQADETLLAELSQVTAWQRAGEAVDLIGSTRMRFRPATN
jgi:hypothetical protein